MMGSKAWHPDPRRPLPSGRALYERDPRSLVDDVRRGHPRTTMGLVLCTSGQVPGTWGLGARLLAADLIGAVLDHFAFPASIREDTTPGNAAANSDPTYQPLDNKGQTLCLLFNVLTTGCLGNSVAPRQLAAYQREVTERLGPLLACLSVDNPDRLLFGEHFHWLFAVGTLGMFIQNTFCLNPDHLWWERFRCFDPLLPAAAAAEATAEASMAGDSDAVTPTTPSGAQVFDNKFVFDKFVTSVIHFALALPCDGWFAEEGKRFPEERSNWQRASRSFSRHTALAVIQLYLLPAQEAVAEWRVNRRTTATVRTFSRAASLRVVDRWEGPRIRRYIVEQLWSKAELQEANERSHDVGAVHVEAYRLAYQALVDAQKLLTAETLLVHTHKDDRAAFLRQYHELVLNPNANPLISDPDAVVWTEDTERAVAAFEKDAEGVREAKILAANLRRGARSMRPDSVECLVDMAWRCLLERKHVDLVATRQRLSEDRRLAAMVKQGLVQGLLQVIVYREDCHTNQDIMDPLKELCVALSEGVTLRKTKAALEEVLRQEWRMDGIAGGASASVGSERTKKKKKKKKKKKSRNRGRWAGSKELTRIWPLVSRVQDMYPVESRTANLGVDDCMRETLEAVDALATVLQPMVAAEMANAVDAARGTSAGETAAGAETATSAAAPGAAPAAAPEAPADEGGAGQERGFAPPERNVVESAGRPMHVPMQMCTVCVKPLTPKTVMRCGKCKFPYCGRECQKQDWKNGHKKRCKVRQKALALERAQEESMTKKDAKRWRQRNQNWSQNVANLFQQRIATLFLMNHCLDAQPNEVVYILDYSASQNPTAESVLVKDFLWKHPVFMNSADGDEGRGHTAFIVQRNAKAMAHTVFGVDPNGGVLVKTVQLPHQAVFALMGIGEEIEVAWGRSSAAQRARLWDRWKKHGEPRLRELF